MDENKNIIIKDIESSVDEYNVHLFGNTYITLYYTIDLSNYRKTISSAEMLKLHIGKKTSQYKKFSINDLDVKLKKF